MTTSHQRKLVKLMEAIRSYDPEIPAQRLVTFLYVAQRGRATRKDVMKSLGLTQTSAYRNLTSLEAGVYRTSAGKPKQGLGWLASEPDEIEPRATAWRVTPKGQRVLDQLEGVLDD